MFHKVSITPFFISATGNTQPVTSNAVAGAIACGIKRRWTETRPPVQGSGTNITWTCIETYDGLKICFGNASSTRSPASWGNSNIYYCSGTDDQWYYPTNFFTQTPIFDVIHVTKVATSGDDWMWATCKTYGTDETKTKLICPASGVQFANNSKISYDIMAIGI